MLHPAEDVDWEMSTTLLAAHGLVLPTDVNWEYSCRAGTTTPWFPGAEPSNLERCANILDAAAKKGTQYTGEHVKFSDGHVIHAPVGTYRPNRFGLYDVHGNVWEWCSNLHTDPSVHRVIRGGSFFDDAHSARSSFRASIAPSNRSYFLGLRAARALF